MPKIKSIRLSHQNTRPRPRCHPIRVAVCCSVLQCVVVSCSILYCVAVCCIQLQCAAACSHDDCVCVCGIESECCSVLQCVAACCSVMPCVSVCFSLFT